MNILKGSRHTNTYPEWHMEKFVEEGLQREKTEDRRTDADRWNRPLSRQAFKGRGSQGKVGGWVRFSNAFGEL